MDKDLENFMCVAVNLTKEVGQVIIINAVCLD